jgi:hypothetical protein
MFDSFSSMMQIPGISDKLVTQSRVIYFGPQELQYVQPGVLLSTITDAGNTPTSLLRAGLLLGRVTASGKETVWTPTAVDGTQFISGILLWDLQVSINGTGVAQFVGPIMRSGMVKASDLIIPGQSTYGLSGQTYEWLARQQLSRRFYIDDTPFHGAGRFRKIQDKTADYTITEAETGCCFTNAGAVGAVIFTLPATAKEGLEYSFFGMVDQTLTITSGTADKIVGFNDVDLDSVSLATSGEIIGGGYKLVGRADGKWMAFMYHGETQTPTNAD